MQISDVCCHSSHLCWRAACDSISRQCNRSPRAWLAVTCHSSPLAGRRNKKQRIKCRPANIVFKKTSCCIKDISFCCCKYNLTELHGQNSSGFRSVSLVPTGIVISSEFFHCGALMLKEYFVKLCRTFLFFSEMLPVNLIKLWCVHWRYISVIWSMCMDSLTSTRQVLLLISWHFYRNIWTTVGRLLLYKKLFYSIGIGI